MGLRECQDLFVFFITSANRREESMATKGRAVDFVEAVASEMALGIDKAVECWLAPIDRALSDRHLTALDRLSGIEEVVRKYKQLTGKVQLKPAPRRSEWITETTSEAS